MTVTEVFDSNYQKMIKEGYVVLDIYGDHCGPCKAMAPYYSQVASDLAYVRFLKVSSDRNPIISKAYGINAVPTLLFMHDGEVKERYTGALDADQLRKHLAKMIYE